MVIIQLIQSCHWSQEIQVILSRWMKFVSSEGFFFIVMMSSGYCYKLINYQDYILYLAKKKQNQRQIENLKHEPTAVYPAQLTEDHKVKVSGKPVSSPLTDANFHLENLCSDIVITGSFSVDQIFFF